MESALAMSLDDFVDVEFPFGHFELAHGLAHLDHCVTGNSREDCSVELRCN